MDTCFTWSQLAPALAIIVVSLIGEMWSPQTAPAMQAEIEMILIGSLASGKAAMQIGIKMPNVPQEVPVAKARPQAMAKMMAGSMFCKPCALPPTRPATYSLAPKESVIAFNVHASVRIKIAGTIALKPSGRQDIIDLNEMTLLIR